MAERTADSANGSGPASVSVVIVNFNGRALLEPLLLGLRAQTHRHRIVLVDNASSDDSVAWVGRYFPEVEILAATENLGFSGGNNLGIHHDSGEFVALINNDTVPDPHWLERLVEEAERDASVAAVGSKILFFRSFLALDLTVETFCPTADGRARDDRQLGVLWDESTAFAGCDYRKPIFRQGFRGQERLGEAYVRWSAGEAVILLPVEHSDRPAELRLRVSGGPSPGRRLRLRIGSFELGEIELGTEIEEHRLTVPASIVEGEARDVINNAGTRLDGDGNAGDRGIYQPDLGQFDTTEEIDAFCGAAVLLRRSALEDVGLFDRDFFMYYEDTDLSWRLRRAGYRLRYQPASVIRHVHASSSGEYSPLFNFYTARNRILMIVKNARAMAALRALGRELATVLRFLVEWIRHPASELARQSLRTRLQVQRSLLRQLPRALAKRFGWIAS